MGLYAFHAAAVDIERRRNEDTTLLIVSIVSLITGKEPPGRRLLSIDIKIQVGTGSVVANIDWMATSSLMTNQEYKKRCVPALLSCFSWRKVRILISFATLLSIPIYTSWVRILRTSLQTKRSEASHYQEPLRIVASSEQKVKS